VGFLPLIMNMIAKTQTRFGKVVRRLALYSDAFRSALIVLVVLGVWPGWAPPAVAALKSGVYQTMPGATVREWGDRVTNGSRIIPFSATLTFDLSASPPLLTGQIANATLEGGAPFPLPVHSTSAWALPNASYRFDGNYLQDLYPSSTGYYFSWTFSTSTNGEVVWNGSTGWAGGHAWYIDISNVVVVAMPPLEITQTWPQVIVSWSSSHTGYTLEQAASVPATDWVTVTNPVVIVGDRFTVAVEAGGGQGYFRLRRF
jgi:hypothetical protein